MRQTALYSFAGENRRKSDSFPHASALSSNVWMTITTLPSVNRVDPFSEGLYLCTVIRPLYRDQAMSPLMESLCGEDVIMIASLVTMM